VTFASIETSVDSARPVELYQISYTGNFWYYTSADRPIVFNNITYAPIACERGDIEPTSDSTRATLDISFPFDCPLGEIFRVTPPSEVVQLTIYAKNYLIDDGYAVIWTGRIINASWEMPWLKFSGESVLGSLNRVGLRRRYQANCPYALFGRQCGVSRQSFREESTMASQNGLAIIVPAAIGKVDDYYAGGYVQWENSVNHNIEKRMIRGSVGSTGSLTLGALPLGLLPGQAVSIFKGCNHLIDDDKRGCKSFNNTDNNGGMPYVPRKNPFGNASIF
jgi:uncharacterized phage protein (TIGR02218 family)